MSVQEQSAEGKNLEADGIVELDNPLPRWWLVTLYGTIIFSVGYWFYYHTTQVGALPQKAYEAEIAEAEAAENARLAELEAKGQGSSEEALQKLSQDSEAVTRGSAVYVTHCQVCHGDRGQGVVGPNLTDGYFLHGAGARDSYQVIVNGVLDKGMPAWKPVLGLSKVRDVLAFVQSIKGKNLPGKAPQGKDQSGTEAPPVPIPGAP